MAIECPSSQIQDQLSPLKTEVNKAVGGKCKLHSKNFVSRSWGGTYTLNLKSKPKGSSDATSRRSYPVSQSPCRLDKPDKTPKIPIRTRETVQAAITGECGARGAPFSQLRLARLHRPGKKKKKRDSSESVSTTVVYRYIFYVKI